MLRDSRPDIIRRCFAAYMSKDRQVLEDALADDFTFTSPYDDAIDKAAYFERCWPNSDRMRSLEVEEIFDRGDQAFVRYRVVTNEGKEFRNVEFFTFDDDRIREINVYFGAGYRNGVLVRE